MESARSTIPGDRNVAQTVLKRRSGYGLRDFSTTQCVKRTHPQSPYSTFAIDAWAAVGIAIEYSEKSLHGKRKSGGKNTGTTTDARPPDRAQDPSRRLCNFFTRGIESLEPTDWIFPRGGRGVSFLDHGERFNIVS